MDAYENFRPRYSIEEIEHIAGQATIEIGIIARECYTEAYKNQSLIHKSDITWNQHCALASVYMLGFLSGARAVRERKRKKVN